VKAGTYIFRKTETSASIKTENKERAASALLHVVEHTTQSLQTNMYYIQTFKVKNTYDMQYK
jgi:hypothetical protein